MSLDKIKREGFVQITTWRAVGDGIKPKSLEWQDHGGWVYAFVVGDEVKYVGLTAKVLRTRLDHYSYGTQDTNARLRSLIETALALGDEVMIFGLPVSDRDEMEREELRLRSELRPEWNLV